MRLVGIDEWRRKHFSEASRPAKATVLRWMRQEKVPGRKIGGTWYVDEAAWLADGDALVESVLRAG